MTTYHPPPRDGDGARPDQGERRTNHLQDADETTTDTVPPSGDRNMLSARRAYGWWTARRRRPLDADEVTELVGGWLR